ncbi:hypothetical protein NHX12_016426 [Muraenolepis orangiensis]|uniref:Uncharacterized protein n=1 Tax=Muraenolepis orangiensis TaxID=630683 RepID=A0A9Q0D4A5_9TELE|nr:hypothetical protein NHX12_016426 [Muraenolepis orangiensis]
MEEVSGAVGEMEEVSGAVGEVEEVSGAVGEVEEVSGAVGEVEEVSGAVGEVEEVSGAVGEVVGYESIKSASRMNSAIVIFLDDEAKVETCRGSLYVHPCSSVGEPGKKNHDFKRTSVHLK